jgi:hypothetical protein
MRDQRTFYLTAFSLLGVLGLAFLHPDQSAHVITTLPILLGVYTASRTSRAISAHWAASKDPNADTESVINQVENTRGVEK